MWNLLYTNVYDLVGSDPLHQLEQGVFRHMMDWLEKMIDDVYKPVAALQVKSVLVGCVKSVPTYPALRKCNNGVFIAQLNCNRILIYQKSKYRSVSDTIKHFM